MTGETNLHKIVSKLNPVLSKDDFVFIHTTRLPKLDEENGFSYISEEEGWTVILVRKEADRSGYNYDQVFRKITLGVHSSLEAVGLTALVSGKLAGASIPCNIVAGYFHDHLFVPAGQVGYALEILNSLQ